MSIRRSIMRLLASGVIALMASCVDSHEEFWIEADGGGRAQITCKLPAAAARIHGGDVGIHRLIEDFFQATPSIKRPRHEVVTTNGRTTVKMEFSFDSALDLMEISKQETIDRLPVAAVHFFGQVETGWKGRSLEITRRIAPGKALPGAAFMPASSLEGRLVTIMHLPVPASGSNATRTENSRHTLIWDTPFAAAVKSPPIYRFKMYVPLPWNLLGWIMGPLAVVGGVVWIRRLKVRAVD